MSVAELYILDDVDDDFVSLLLTSCMFVGCLLFRVEFWAVSVSSYLAFPTGGGRPRGAS
ncbi:hypothetical protein BDW69DRAFT_169150 [Aspergillus filifer]